MSFRLLCLANCSPENFGQFSTSPDGRWQLSRSDQCKSSHPPQRPAAPLERRCKRILMPAIGVPSASFVPCSRMKQVHEILRWQSSRWLQCNPAWPTPYKINHHPLPTPVRKVAKTVRRMFSRQHPPPRRELAPAVRGSSATAPGPIHAEQCTPRSQPSECRNRTPRQSAKQTSPKNVRRTPLERLLRFEKKLIAAIGAEL